MATLTATTNKPCIVCAEPCSLTVRAVDDGVVLYRTGAWVIGNDLFTDGTPRLVCSYACATKALYGTEK